MEHSATYHPALASIFSLLLMASVTGAHAQKLHTVDLAQNMDGKLSETVDAGSLRVVIKNKLPGELNYDIKCIISTQVVDEFSLDVLRQDSAQYSLNKQDDPACNVIQSRIQALKKLKSESVLADTLLAVRNVLNDTHSTCADANKKKEMLDQVQRMTEWTLEDTFLLRNGEVLTIVVSREIDGKTHTWTHVLTTPTRGQWYVTYGFSFITNMFNAEETYFAKSVPDTTLYTITKKNSNTSLTFVPCVLVHWVPTRWANNSFVPSLTGGLGFDLESPSVFFGGSVLFNSNLGIHLGVAAHKQNHLNGMYSAGEIIKENLTEDQLNERFYTVNPFVSLSFRFSGSPFSAVKKTTVTGSR